MLKLSHGSAAGAGGGLVDAAAAVELASSDSETTTDAANWRDRRMSLLLTMWALILRRFGVNWMCARSQPRNPSPLTG
jgi:hypothetical protein